MTVPSLIDWIAPINFSFLTFPFSTKERKYFLMPFCPHLSHIQCMEMISNALMTFEYLFIVNTHLIYLFILFFFIFFGYHSINGSIFRLLAQCHFFYQI